MRSKLLSISVGKKGMQPVSRKDEKMKKTEEPQH